MFGYFIALPTRLPRNTGNHDNLYSGLDSKAVPSEW
jgi:hypothetical protein